MESHISASEAAQTFPEMIERVHSQGEVFIVEQGGEPMCRISPVSPPQRTVRELVALLRTLPQADSAYFDAVEEVVKNQPLALGNPWER